VHWLQPFVLLVGPEHVLLRLRTQTTWILLNAKLLAKNLKVIAHTESTSVSKIKKSPKIFTNDMFIIQCSVQWEGCACFALQSLSKRGRMRDKHTRMSCSMSSLVHCKVHSLLYGPCCIAESLTVTSLWRHCSVSKKYYQDMGQRPTAQVVSKRRSSLVQTSGIA